MPPVMVIGPVTEVGEPTFPTMVAPSPEVLTSVLPMTA
jgi:hypothetical protein